MENETYGELLRELRKQKRKTLGDVARALDVTVAYVSDVELGRRNPLAREQTLIVAELFEIDATELLRAAVATRRRLELDLSKTGAAGVEHAATLAREWPTFDEADFRQLHEALREIIARKKQES